MPNESPAAQPWEATCRALAASTPDWESWHDAAGRVRWVNHVVARITGYTIDECQAMPDFPLALLVPECRSGWEGALLSSGAGERRRVEIVRKDGVRRWVSLAWHPVLGPDGVRVGYRTSAHDIHESIEAEQSWSVRENDLAARVQATEARYQLVTDHATDVILTCGFDGRVLWISPSVERLLGYPPDEITGGSFDRLLTVGGRALVGAVFGEARRLVEEGRPVPEFRFEVEHVRRDGTVLWVEVSGTVVEDADAGSPGFVVMTRDIDARRRTEEALRASEERYRLLADHVTDVIWTTDLQGVLSYVSPASERLFGRATSDLIGTAALATMTSESAARMRAAVLNAVARAADGDRDVTFGIEAEHVRHDGATVWTEIHGSILRGEAGGPTAVLGVSRDISERRRAQAIALQASRMQATATLAGGIAHDFNNLMVAVLGYAELLRTDMAGRPDLGAMIDEIVAAATRASELSQQMLAYARGGRYQPRDIDLDGLVEQVVRQQERTAPPHVRLLCDLQPGLWPVNADPRQMAQMLTSLCANAVEAISGAGEVTIATKNVVVGGPGGISSVDLQPGRWVRLTVTDSGCGMTPDVQSRMFEPFFSTKFTGRGLGLPAAQGIVENHGGRVVVVATAPGQGTTLAVFLPAASSQ